MTLQIVARNMKLTDTQREIVERRLGFALGRFGARICRVEVLLTDANGPRGGVDTMCQVVARIAPSGTVRAEVTDVGVEAAASRAAERISRRVSTELERRRRTRGVRETPYADNIGGLED